uniref:Uncharacterized protein n=1 Tax=Loigolactobacillus rennini TaxID=238013 RepID=A0A1K2I416_9LACO|nr:Hypothetical protein LREN565_0086 [Loigolactobacillus rennini]
MPSSTIFRQHTRLNAATNKTTKKISHTRRSPKDRNYPSTPFDKLPKITNNCIIKTIYIKFYVDGFNYSSQITT